MKEKLSKIQVEALEQINSPDANLDEIRIKYLGKKGEITQLMKMIGSAAPEERAAIGQLINSARAELDGVFESAIGEINAKEKAERLKNVRRYSVPIAVCFVGKRCRGKLAACGQGHFFAFIAHTVKRPDFCHKHLTAAFF